MIPINAKMALRNIWRNKRRSILTILALALSTAILVFMLSWQFGAYETMINAMVRMQSGHLQIQANGYQERKDMYLVVPQPERIEKILKKIKEVRAYTFRSNAFALLSSEKRTYGAFIIGVDPSLEGTVSPVPDLVREGKFLSPDSNNGVVMGKLLAKNLKVNIGDEVVLLGQGKDGSVAATVVKVQGIFSSGQDELDRTTLFISLPFFQEVFSMGDSVHQVIILLDSLKSVDRVKGLLQEALKSLAETSVDTKTGQLVIIDWVEALPGLVEAIKMDLSSGLIFYIILVVIVAFSIMNTFLMAVFERKKEFGILIAIGVKPPRLAGILLLESILMTFTGISIGIVLGSIITLYFQSHGITIAGASDLLRQYGLPARMYPMLSFLSIISGAAIVLIITFFAACYPALLAMRIRPVEAIR